MIQLAEKYSEAHLDALIEELLDYSERLVRAELRTMPSGEFSAEDWLDELVLMEALPGLTSRDWRSITIAASARLANRVNASSQPIDV